MISGLWRGPKNESAFCRSANPEPKGTPAGTGCPSATSARDRGFLSKIASETNCISELGSFERSCLKRVSKEKNHTGRFPVPILTLAPCLHTQKHVRPPTRDHAYTKAHIPQTQ